ncbi:MFS transporter [Salinibacterium sp. ZJ450]|uniref:MFS transporter n=1 Tax=Salinibacterium sp. ZJ450 TaxID=2708338 RepID=UPI0014230BFC|nr:MFS transporter [Salinibacterium sp. ZJ450]
MYSPGSGPSLTRRQYVRWRYAVFAIFAASGLSWLTWASRIPAIKADLGIDNAGIGLLILCMGVASIVGLLVSSTLIAKFGTRAGMRAMMLMVSLGLFVIGLGTSIFPLVWLVVAGLVLFGFGNACLDIMMNVDGGAIEVKSGKTLLPLFHSFFSVGTVIGAAFGVAAAAQHISVFWHCLAMSLMILVIAFTAIANVPPRPATDDTLARETAHTARPGQGEPLARDVSAWREPRTYALGIVVLGMAFAEGGANDWLALGVSEDHNGGPAAGAAALTVFSVSMMIVRMLGGPLVDRFGRVLVLRVMAGCAAGGILLFILAPNLPLVFVGAVLWGVGASLGFPLGLSAAGDDPAKAAARVSATATIGYISLLAGPPVLGVVSEHLGLLETLFIVVALVAASGVAAGAAKPLPSSERVTVK